MELYGSEKECCGCGTCAAACPRKAVIMKEDRFGFCYPEIDEALCVECGLCKSVCGFQKEIGVYAPRAVYAAARKYKDALLKSSSGGAFAVFAEMTLQDGGAVFGAVLRKEASGWNCCHCMAEDMEKLLPVFGSKYLQSNLGNTFAQAREQLETGRGVLFSGTPCQIGGLKAFLKKEYTNLLTIDLVCHGVPSVAMFQEYLGLLEKRLGGSITDFRFRDKTHGWGLNGQVTYQDAAGNIHKKQLPSFRSSYYELFLRGELYRDSCYSCPYAGKQHPADITLGDFWGFEKEHPEALRPKGQIEPEQGVSLLIVNTRKGAEWLTRCQNEFFCVPSVLEKAARYNRQLRHPSTPGKEHTQLFALYQARGYSAVDEAFTCKNRGGQWKKWVKYYLRRYIPAPVRRQVKKIIGAAVPLPGGHQGF